MTTQIAPLAAKSASGVLGEVFLSGYVRDKARDLALTHYREAEAQDFSGDSVGDQALPDWLPALHDWFPAGDIGALGYARNELRQPCLLTTVGVDSHVDNIYGPVFVWVLHNDGLTFKQGRQVHSTLPGQWFIFNDRLAHSVRESKKSTSYVCVAIPLKQIETASPASFPDQAKSSKAAKPRLQSR